MSQSSDPTRFTRRNYWVFVAEGGLFGAGLSFVALDTVLPTIAHSLQGSDSIIAFLPMAMMLGFYVPPLFTAHWLERLGRLMPTLRFYSLLQRLPYAVAALALWFMAGDSPGLALAAVAAAPLISGVFGGITVAAWFRLTSRMVPGKRRSSATAWRNMIAAIAGIGAGLIVEKVFSHLPGAPGFALLHALAFGGLMLSYVVFCMSDEPDVPPPPREDHKSLVQQLRSLPAALRDDPGFRYYALSRAFGSLVYVTIPFMAIHAANVTGAGPSLAGKLLAWQMGGVIVGNSLGAWLGDRHGSRAVLVATQAASLLMLAVFAMSSSPSGHGLAFALWGIGTSMQMIGEGTFLTEHASGPRMPTYISLSFLAALSGMLAAGGTSALLRHLSETIGPLVSVSCGGVALALVLLIAKTPEPRHSANHSSLT